MARQASQNNKKNKEQKNANERYLDYNINISKQSLKIYKSHILFEALFKYHKLQTFIHIPLSVSQ